MPNYRGRADSGERSAERALVEAATDVRGDYRARASVTRMTRAPPRYRLAAALYFLAALASVMPAQAYRPFDGTDAAVAERGVFELELGPTHFYRRGNRNYLIAPATVLNLGILERAELVVESDDFVALDPHPGIPGARLLGTDVLLKYVFREGTPQGRSGIGIAAEAGPLLPEINGTTAFGASVDAIVSYRWPALSMHVNERAEYTRAHNAFIFNGVILEGPHDWVTRPVAEFFYSREAHVGDEASALLGAIWTLRDSFALDLGVRGARIQHENELEVRLGFTLALPTWGQVENAAGRAGSARAVTK